MFGVFQAILHVFSTKASRRAAEDMPELNFSKGEVGKHFKKMTPAQRKKHLVKVLELKKLDKIHKQLKVKEAKKKKALALKRKKAAEVLKKKLKVGRVVSIKGIKYVVVAKKRGKPIMTTLAKFKRNKRTRIRLSSQPVIIVDNTPTDDGLDFFDALMLAEILTIDSSPSYQSEAYEANDSYDGDSGSFSGGGSTGGWDEPSAGNEAPTDSYTDSNDGGGSDSGGSDSGSGSDN